MAHHPLASGAGPSSDPGEPSLPVSCSCPQDVLTCQTCPAAAIAAGPSLLAVLSLSGPLFLKLVLRRYLQVEFPPPAPQAGPSSPGIFITDHQNSCPYKSSDVRVSCLSKCCDVCVSRPSVLLSPSVSRPGAVLLSLPSRPLSSGLCPMYIFVS